MPRHLKGLRKSWEKLKSTEALLYETIDSCKKTLPKVPLSPMVQQKAQLRRRCRSHNILNNLNEPKVFDDDVDYRKDIREKLAKYNQTPKRPVDSLSFTYYSEKVLGTAPSSVAGKPRPKKMKTVGGFQVPCKTASKKAIHRPKEALSKPSHLEPEREPLELVSRSYLVDDYLPSPGTDYRDNSVLKEYKDLYMSQHASLVLSSSEVLRQSFDYSDPTESPVRSKLEQMIKLQGFTKQFKFGREHSPTPTSNILKLKSGSHGLLRKAPTKILRRSKLLI